MDRGRSALAAVLVAAHIGPALVVTAVVAMLAAAEELGPGTGVVVTLAVLAGQLTIGWGNDLVDAPRDREVGRRDKPLADGRLSPALVRRCLVVAGVACVVLSIAVGWRSALVHLALMVGGGHAYNLGLKATAWSWLPYAVAFGTLPAVVTLAGSSPAWPPLWMLAVAAMLGVGAHFLNALPDFDDDAATGVRGLPHRLGRTTTRAGATVLLVAASAAAVLGPPGDPTGWSWAALGLVGGLGVVALLGRGRLPFLAAVVIALVDVALLTVGR
ncbi:MAG TPA: UbiA family prenyltransferase [Marmoricola sp.]|nr:UbiA family prenyltransferase [Marmoricola sp.]